MFDLSTLSYHVLIESGFSASLSPASAILMDRVPKLANVVGDQSWSKPLSVIWIDLSEAILIIDLKVGHLRALQHQISVYILFIAGACV